MHSQYTHFVAGEQDMSITCIISDQTSYTSTFIIPDALAATIW